MMRKLALVAERRAEEAALADKAAKVKRDQLAAEARARGEG